MQRFLREARTASGLTHGNIVDVSDPANPVEVGYYDIHHYALGVAVAGDLAYVAAGRFDGIALPAAQEKMAARIKGASTQFFDGGHMFMLQDRAALPAMIAFLKG